MTLTTALAIFISGALREYWPSISKGLGSGYRSSARWGAKATHDVSRRLRYPRSRNEPRLLVNVVKGKRTALKLPAKPRK